MKHFLLGTTALAAVALLSVGAQAAPPTLKISGNYETAFVFGDDGNQKDGSSSLSNNIAKIYLSVLGATDTGLQYGVKVSLRAWDSAPSSFISNDQISDSYAFLQGTFGRTEIGSVEGVGNKMGESSPVLDAAGMVLVNSPNYAPNGTGWNIDTINTSLNLSGHAQKINYYTPRVAGFQLGLAYAPTSCSTGSDTNGSGNAACPTGGTFASQNGNAGQNGEVALNFTRTVAGAKFGISSGFGNQLNGGRHLPTSQRGMSIAPDTIKSGDYVAPYTANQDRQAYNFGANLAFAVSSGMLTVGSSYLHVDNAGFASNTDSDAYEAAVQFARGSWTAGLGAAYGTLGAGPAVTYAPNSTAAAVTTPLPQYRVTAFAAGLGYQVAEGLQVSAGAMQYLYNNPNTVSFVGQSADISTGTGTAYVGAPSTQPDSATVFLTGLSIDF